MTVMRTSAERARERELAKAMGVCELKREQEEEDDKKDNMVRDC